MTLNTFKTEIKTLINLVHEQDNANQFDEAQKIRRLIESKLAAQIISEPNKIWESVNKVSESFIQLLQNNVTLIEGDNTLSALLVETVKGLHDEEAFGRLVLAQNEKLADKSKVDFVINLLTNSYDLPIVVHLHALLGQHLMLPLLNHPEVNAHKPKGENNTLASLAARLIAKTPELRQALRKKFYLYESSGRGRFEDKKAVQATTHIGIVQENEAKIAEYYPSHVRAADKFLPDIAHPYYQEYIQKSSLPFVAGPSGHAGILFRTATMVAQLSASEMKEYALAVLGIIVGGGMHTTNEIMLMFKQLGFEYSSGDYQFILDLLNDEIAISNDNDVMVHVHKPNSREELLFSFNGKKDKEQFSVVGQKTNFEGLKLSEASKNGGVFPHLVKSQTKSVDNHNCWSNNDSKGRGYNLKTD